MYYALVPVVGVLGLAHALQVLHPAAKALKVLPPLLARSNLFFNPF